MYSSDFNYCEINKESYSDKEIKRTNKCKFFELNPIDSLFENEKGYVPRKPKTKLLGDISKQQTLFDKP
jgi:hypothetical protein